MKHLKVTSALLAAVMCITMAMSPVMADETETPSETQTAETTDEENVEETEEPDEYEPGAVEETPLEGEDRKDALDAVLAKGKCGKKVKWSLDKKGTLKITGKGAMNNFTLNPTAENTAVSTAPWFKYSSKIKKVTISKKVTTVGNFAFFCCSNLNSVKFSKKLKSIGIGAFESCSKLKSITIPKKVKTIGNAAFAGCSGITSIKFSNGVTTIGDFAFSSVAVKTLALPKSLKSIGESAFRYCSALEKISIPSSVKTIGNYAFANCSKLTTVTVPVSGLTSIGASAFRDCKELSGFEFPLTVTSVGDNAFESCVKLCRVWISPKQKANLPANVFYGCSYVTYDEHKYSMIGDGFSDVNFSYKISDPAINGTGTVDIVAIKNKDAERLIIPAAVSYCDEYGMNKVTYKVTGVRLYSTYNLDLKVKTLVIGPNVTTIYGDSFADCHELESVTGGAGLKTIGAEAFECCHKLKVFNISSKTLKSIGAYAFGGDEALTTLQLKKTIKLTKAGVKNSLKDSSVTTVKVKKSKVKKYKKIFKANNCGKKVKVKK